MFLNYIYLSNNLSPNVEHSYPEQCEDIRMWVILMWHIGACIGSFVCGLNIVAWPATETNVSQWIYDPTNSNICFHFYCSQHF